jgi:hypothetical protein
MFDNDFDDTARWRAGLAALLLALGLVQLAAWAVHDMPRAARVLVVVSGLAAAGAAGWQTYARYRPRLSTTARVAIAAWAVVVGVLVVVAGFGTALGAGWLWLVAIGAWPWKQVTR